MRANVKDQLLQISRVVCSEDIFLFTTKGRKSEVNRSILVFQDGVKKMTVLIVQFLSHCEDANVPPGFLSFFSVPLSFSSHGDKGLNALCLGSHGSSTELDPALLGSVQKIRG